MKTASRFVILCALAIALAGCSTPGARQVLCLGAGALVGGGAAALGTDGDDGAIAASAVGGALLASLVCPEEEKPAPAPAPAPKPAPKPEPKPAPDPDTDGDGVVDSLDKCPGTPAGTPVDAMGCPEIPNLSGVHFEHDKARLTDDARSQLNAAAATLQNNPHVGVKIVGHTDASGSDSYNLELSERRAASVSAYLQSQGIAAERISTSGQGESAPIASNDTKAGRAENRRVELTAHQMM